MTISSGDKHARPIIADLHQRRLLAESCDGKLREKKKKSFMTNTAARVLTAACSLSIDAGIPRFDLSKSDYRLGIHGIFSISLDCRCEGKGKSLRIENSSRTANIYKRLVHKSHKFIDHVRLVSSSSFSDIFFLLDKLPNVLTDSHFAL
jgi:hypothetical protein